MFFLPAFFALTQVSSRALASTTAPAAQRDYWSDLWRMLFIFLVAVIGFRHQVGGDWSSYLSHVNSLEGASVLDALKQKNPSTGLLNFVAANSGGGVYFVNMVCAVLFVWGLLAFCRAQPRPWLALVVAVPYLVIVVAMGYTSQGVAIGLGMLGLVALGQGRVLRFVLWVALAATFHKSAVILVPLAVIGSTQRRIFTILWVVAATLLLFGLLLQESVDALTYGYIDAKYESSGAVARIAMNAVPAALFLLLRRRFQLPLQQRKFWTWMAWGALAFVVLLNISPSSTAVDRVALYLIPLQLFVWSRIPDVLGQPGRGNPSWVLAVVVYSAAVLFVWLFFGTFSYTWLPYQFYPWVWLWQ